MFDLGTWGELFIIALAALIFIGPKEMPTLLRALGRLIQRFKFLSSNIRREVDQYIQEGEVEAYIKKSHKDGMMTPLTDDIGETDDIADEEKEFQISDDLKPSQEPLKKKKVRTAKKPLKKGGKKNDRRK